jgi:hypothetical protein
MTTLASPRVTAAAALLALAVSLTGCGGKSGPLTYELVGQVTYNGKPIPLGDIRFEPTQGVVNKDTVGYAMIRDGEYCAEVVGGPHRVSIRDLSADSSDGKGARPMFGLEYYTEVVLPTADKVEPGATQDFDVPASHK